MRKQPVSPEPHFNKDVLPSFSSRSPPVMPFYRLFFRGRVPLKKGTLILTSLLEERVFFSRRASCSPSGQQLPFSKPMATHLAGWLPLSGDMKTFRLFLGETKILEGNPGPRKTPPVFPAAESYGVDMPASFFGEVSGDSGLLGIPWHIWKTQFSRLTKTSNFQLKRPKPEKLQKCRNSGSEKT